MEDDRTIACAGRPHSPLIGGVGPAYICRGKADPAARASDQNALVTLANSVSFAISEVERPLSRLTKSLYAFGSLDAE